MKKRIGYTEAFELTLSHMPLTGPCKRRMDQAAGMVLAEDLAARVDNPSLDVSLKDGYAVVSNDLEYAAADSPVELSICGAVNAGKISEISLENGRAMRITTGAPIPKGATAVIAEEFCERRGNQLRCFNTAGINRNILKRGTDIRQGDIIANQGEKITPALIGLLVSAGFAEISVYRVPHITVFGTGDEIVAPGMPLMEGRLYASNIAATCGWLYQYGFSYHVELIPDNFAQLVEAFEKQLPHTDAFVTSGGVWGSEKDLMIKALGHLSWKGIYHRVRLGPGKAVAFGLLRQKPVFSLPGGPPSHEMAFLQLALPGLLAMKGDRQPPFTVISAELAKTVTGAADWVQFIHARLFRQHDRLMVSPFKPESRLIGMARKHALIKIPEGVVSLEKGENIPIQLLT